MQDKQYGNYRVTSKRSCTSLVFKVNKPKQLEQQPSTWAPTHASG